LRPQDGPEFVCGDWVAGVPVLVAAKRFLVTALFNPETQSLVHDGGSGQLVSAALAVEILEDVILKANRYQLRHTISIPYKTYRSQDELTAPPFRYGATSPNATSSNASEAV
jgi:hypothetical protein